MKTHTGAVEAKARICHLGAGRKILDHHDPNLWAALDALVEPATRNDLETLLRCTCKSTRRLAQELCRQEHPISSGTVANMLRDLGYSLQANRKVNQFGNLAGRDSRNNRPKPGGQSRPIKARRSMGLAAVLRVCAVLLAWHSPLVPTNPTTEFDATAPPHYPERMVGSSAVRSARQLAELGYV